MTMANTIRIEMGDGPSLARENKQHYEAGYRDGENIRWRHGLEACTAYMKRNGSPTNEYERGAYDAMSGTKSRYAEGQ